MATVLDLITDALITVKALAVGETPGASMSTDALTKFNEILEALSIQNLAVYSNLVTTFPLVPGVGSYTIGPTGSVVAQRPPFVDVAFVTINGVDYSLDVHSTDEYAALALKNQQGLPNWVCYNQDYPNGTLLLWPVPSMAGTLTLYQNKLFTSAATIIDTFDMPPGYRKMIRLMLAWELLSDYPGMTQAEIMKLDGDLKNATALVKRNTDKPEMLRSEVADMDCSSGGGYANWRTGA